MGVETVMEKIRKVVITGGPCAGKTTAIDRAKLHFEKQGTRVIVVDEVPTEIMRMGITLAGFGKMPFQKAIIDLQRKKEQVVLEAASSIEDPKGVLVIFDRGILDHFIYLDSGQQHEMEQELGIQRQELYRNYDMVIHMLSVAAEIPTLYEKTEYRLEDASEAEWLDQRIGEIWQPHPGYVRVGCESDFDRKIERVITMIEGRNEP